MPPTDKVKDEEKYPEHLIVTLDDFKTSNWADTLSETKKESYREYSQALSAKARSLIAEKRLGSGKALWLLADACSLLLKPENAHEVFQPFAIIDNRRSAILADFTAADIDFFVAIEPEIDNCFLRARISDILWIRRIPRNNIHALSAIDAYLKFPLNSDFLLHPGQDYWLRAIRLSKLLKQAGNEKLQHIGGRLFDAFSAATEEEKFYIIFLSRLLAECNVAPEIAAKIGAKLEAFAKSAPDNLDWHLAAECFSEAIKWQKQMENQTDATRLTVMLGELYERQAESSKLDKALHLSTGHWYERAIQTFRKIPRAERKQHNIEQRLLDAQNNMNQANRQVLGVMGGGRASVNIADLIQQNELRVTGQNKDQALLTFSEIHPTASVSELEAGAREHMSHSFLQGFFSSTHLASDGRVIARVPGFNVRDATDENRKKAFDFAMLRRYMLQIELIVTGAIAPALRIIRYEHHLRLQDFELLCRKSTIIPPDRESLWAKGIMEGFDWDFVVSTHLLIPQVEHLVRFVMKQNGLKTSTVDQFGIETENGLSTLLEHPEIEKAIHADLVFELRYLLTEAGGPNLRNEMAHGLLNENYFHTAPAVYFWWFCFTLIMGSIPENKT